MTWSESPVGIVAQAAVALALVAGAAGLAVLDPATRPQIAGAFELGLGAVVGYFFSQRSTAAGGAVALGGISHAAGLASPPVQPPPGGTS